MDEYVVYGHEEKLTLDGEWTYDELDGDVYDVVAKYYERNNVSDRYKGKALYDTDLLKPQYMVEEIKCGVDLIEVYNTEYNKRKEENKFGITYFDEWVENQIQQKLKGNEVLK